MNARVLVVDDRATTREELCKALASGGFRVTDVGDGAAALAAVAADIYDVCITHTRMPGIVGIELLRRLGTDSPETMVIVIPSFGGRDAAIEALRHGATDYALEPVIFEEILGKVRRLVESRELAREVRSLRRAQESRIAAPADPEAPVNLQEATRRFEADHILRIIALCGGDKRSAARKMGLSLSTLYRKLEAARPDPPARNEDARPSAALDRPSRSSTRH